MMAGRIAILGWGSLIWDLEILTPHVRGDWHMSGGPALPMEFSRVSPKRKQALAVCLDPEVGVDCPTHAIASVRGDIARARDDLAARERAPLHRIGAFHRDGVAAGRMPAVVARVRAWCDSTGWAGAVWTDLEPNFLAETGQPYTVVAGIAYLKTLTGESLYEAYHYIQNAPAQTRTPLRTALQDDPWWAGLGLTLRR